MESRNKRISPRTARLVRRSLRVLLGGFSVSLILTGLFVWLVRTDEDRVLRRENKQLKANYSALKQREDRITDVVEYLQYRDDAIYYDLFYAEAPSLEMFRSDDFIAGADTLPQGDLILYTARKADRMLSDAERVEENFRAIARLLGERGDTLPPMLLPIEDASYAQIGASLGERMSPFLKVSLNHSGLDILAPQDTPVSAAADGRVTAVSRGGSGRGRSIEIEHTGGWRTRYCYLGDIRVSPGQKVSRSQIIGTVGMSGNSFAPHLHYEVLRDTLVLDPASHFFGSVTPAQYLNLLYMSAHTGQSLD